VMNSITIGQVKKVEVQYRGAIAEMDVNAATTGFTIGLLERQFDVPLNVVNARVLAKERGISIDEMKNPDIKDVASSFTAKVVTDKVTRSITGTIFGENLLRIIEIDGFKIEMTPQGSVLVIFNDDKPGVIGAVGTIIGKHGINIGTMGVGQKLEERKAILAVSLDKLPDEKMLKDIGKLDFVNESYVCKLD
jgi:D-3-phosphoglycerate dehydrogenase / 2-oxoglutarate reductase